MSTEAIEDVRPDRLERRRTALLDAATIEFMAKGYEKATLTDIIARAGGSRSTIYKEFGNKADLFKAVGIARAEELRKLLKELWNQDGDLRESLGRYGRAYVKALLEPAAIQLHKNTIAEASRFPELGRAFFDAHADGVAHPIANYLRHLDELGDLRVENPDRAARLFIVMVKGNFQLQAMIDPDRPIPQAEIDSHIDCAVGLFVKGLEPRA
jgi:AcrR family transcriptional regulator